MPTDAGVLQQRIERERQATLPARVTPQPAASPGATSPSSSLSVPVGTFVFKGNTLLSNEQLGSVLSAYSNRNLDYTQLQEAAAAVAQAYRTAGWLANAFLPPQDIRDGKVTIEVVEAVFGGTKIEGQAQRVSAAQVLEIVGAQQSPGQALNIFALDRAQLLADDLPGIAVSGALSAGAVQGQTDLVLKITDEPVFIANMLADNHGALSTGTARATASFYVNNPSNTGDQINATVMATEGTRYARLGYGLPVGSDGWRVGANASYLGYKLVNADADGNSHSLGLEARYPVIRSRLKNLFLELTADRKSFDNRWAGESNTRYTTEALGVSLSGNAFDDAAGGGVSTATLGWVSGRRDNQTGTTDSRYNKWHYAVSRQQNIASGLSAFASWNGQASSDNLDTSESFYLGGANGVRAYPSSEGHGSSGDLAKLELRWRTSSTLSSALFYDHGRVRNRDGSPSYSLKGAGLTLAWQASTDFNLSATLARRIGSNPNASVTTGSDQDGSLHKNRVWLAASLNF
ncbi:ShlB/FhaC/HecB family hemolysin secretion/activation protein [Limnohabitans sp. Hippo3]|uniref:ShlB/FhaC/HecB family hemolysin secretion/activation protein n=1 Tax=Limnohabitans sp. Hippo3 TaxID=1597956 RepID=UPI001E337758|nr:ShlB/FhaC/HecB family hemolysin secretion/activation protein [Limnohabitans sp. Hippo3]